MGSILVVGSAASLQLRARIVKAYEPMRVLAFPAQLTVERLDERIVGRLPRPREIERHAMRIGPESRSRETNSLPWSTRMLCG
jgi:hypothetical protein